MLTIARTSAAYKSNRYIQKGMVPNNYIGEEGGIPKQFQFQNNNELSECKKAFKAVLEEYRKVLPRDQETEIIDSLGEIFRMISYAGSSKRLYTTSLTESQRAFLEFIRKNYSQIDEVCKKYLDNKAR